MALHPTHAISVCSGYGGIDLGLRLALGGSCRTVLYCEREAYPASILVGQMEALRLDPAPIWSDLHTLPAGDIIDRLGLDPANVILHGGIPCQPWSSAGQRRGDDDPRWLWPAFWRIARENGLGWIFLENVRGFVSGQPAGLDLVLRDLSYAGWDAEWGLFSAEECGAPHRRERLFLLAHNCQGGCGQELHQNDVQERRPALVGDGDREYWPSRPGENQHPWEAPRVVVYAKSARHQRRRRLDMQGQARLENAGEAGPGGEVEPHVGRVVDGSAAELDSALASIWSGRISALGNGVVPLTAAVAFRVLHGRLRREQI